MHDVVLFSHAQQYAEQKTLLDRLDEKTGVDVFNASCSLIDTTQGRYSYAVWSRDVVTTLPRADRIAFVERGPDGKPRSLGMADWGRVRDVMGDAMRPLEHHPPRWAVDSFPTEGQQRELQLDPITS